MTLRSRISIFVTILFSILYAIIGSTVIFLFSQFRSEEFQDRLRQKALSTIELLIELKETDQELIKNLDRQKVDNLFNEKTLVFNKDFKLIYSSLYDSLLTWEKHDLLALGNQKEFFKRINDTEVFGSNFNYKNEPYYILISAKDTSGLRKLKYLIYVIFFSFIIFSMLSLFFTRIVIDKLLKPINYFHKKIKTINENNLGEPIEIKSETNEIDLLANEFNLMLKRIDNSLKNQSEFTANASHELRTPIARMMAQIENKLSDENISTDTKTFLNKILLDINQISDLIHSLLILSKNEKSISNQEQMLRLDEIVYSCIDKINQLYPDCKIYFDIHLENNLDDIKEVRGNKTMLEIVFMNLINNAYNYSTNKEIKIQIVQKEYQINCSVSNNGKSISESEQKRLFEPFMRGQNSIGTNGFGLGLRIVERILNIHNSKIRYTVGEDNSNEFTLTFPLHY
jgi:signal transduction histidine kinase